MIARNALALPAAVALAAMIPHSPAAAQTEHGLANSTVIIDLGVAGAVAPAYEGAKVYKLQPGPAISLTWGETLKVSNGTAQVALIQLPWLKAGPLAAYRPGRKEDDSHRLKGLGDIDDAFDLGAFARFEFGGWSTEISARQDVSGDGGALVDIGAGYALPVSESITLSAGVDATWASDDYMASNFGITRRQAARSRYDQYKAEAGFKDVGVSLGARYALTERWAVTAGANYSRLLGDAADSPIVKDGGSANQFVGFLAVTYRFGL